MEWRNAFSIQVSFTGFRLGGDAIFAIRIANTLFFLIQTDFSDRNRKYIWCCPLTRSCSSCHLSSCKEMISCLRRRSAPFFDVVSLQFRDWLFLVSISSIEDPHHEEKNIPLCPAWFRSLSSSPSPTSAQWTSGKNWDGNISTLKCCFADSAEPLFPQD